MTDATRTTRTAAHATSLFALCLLLGACDPSPERSLGAGDGSPTSALVDSTRDVLTDSTAALGDSIEVTVGDLNDGWLHGRVRNASSVDLLGVTVYFDLYDASGRLVRSAHSTRYDLAAGAEGGFHIRTKASEGVTAAQFAGLELELPHDYESPR